MTIFRRKPTEAEKDLAALRVIVADYLKEMDNDMIPDYQYRRTLRDLLRQELERGQS